MPALSEAGGQHGARWDGDGFLQQPPGQVVLRHPSSLLGLQRACVGGNFIWTRAAWGAVFRFRVHFNLDWEACRCGPCWRHSQCTLMCATHPHALEARLASAPWPPLTLFIELCKGKMVCSLPFHEPGLGRGSFLTLFLFWGVFLWDCALWTGWERNRTELQWSMPAMLKSRAPGSTDKYLRVLRIRAGSYFKSMLGHVQGAGSPPVCCPWVSVGGWWRRGQAATSGQDSEEQGVTGMLRYLFDTNISGEPQTKLLLRNVMKRWWLKSGTSLQRVAIWCR